MSAINIARLGIGAGALAIATIGLLGSVPPIEPPAESPISGVRSAPRFALDILSMPLLESSGALFVPTVVQNPPRLVAERRREEELIVMLTS